MDSESRPLRTIDFEKLFFAHEMDAWEMLADWANGGAPSGWEVVRDIVRDSFKAGFKRGAWSSKNGVNVNKVWVKYFHAQKKLFE